MTLPFPWNHPPATAGYLSFYMATLVVHIGFMGYVLGGTCLLAGRQVVGWAARARRQDNLAEVLLRDWLPFFLGAAITAGVAPLLFLQVLFGQRFYTANLLLVHRWMAILPALMVAFYLLYLMKTAWYRTLGSMARACLACTAWLLFVFVAWTWTENHLLSVASRDTWVSFYARGAHFYHDPALVPRLSIWLGGAMPIMATIVAAQIVWLRRARLNHPHKPDSSGQLFAVTDNIAFEARRLPLIVAVGAAVAGAGALSYPVPTDITFLWTPATRLYVVGGIVGVVLQTLGWVHVWRQRHVGSRALAILWPGLVLAMVGVTVVRESLRLSHLNLENLLPQHQKAAGIGGLEVFVAFALLNAGLIGWCLHTCAHPASHTMHTSSGTPHAPERTGAK